MKYQVNVVSIFQNHDMFIKENQYQTNKKNHWLKPYHFTISIWYGTDMLISVSMEMWETNINLMVLAGYVLLQINI